MKICSMTATFGKLENAVLTLEDGLNILEAPNEWGKSTWCSFLTAMLYGIETRTHSTKTALADKERYAPWSGAPMSGRMEIDWQGRKITIERSSAGRAVFGKFRAYETDTGICVPELTAENCGQMLLGVEKSVFVRTAFVRQTDLPVNQDEALRRRLNALVTTGDESGTADTLSKTLKDLKNRCRFNRTGLLPQAEQERSDLQQKLRELQDLQQQKTVLEQQGQELEQRIGALQNHRNALEYAQALEDQSHIEEAKRQKEQSTQLLEQLEAQCETLPDEKTVRTKIERIRLLDSSLSDLREQERLLEEPILPPAAPAPFAGMTGEQAVEQARRDCEAMAGGGIWPKLLVVLGAICLLGGAYLLWRQFPAPGVYVPFGVGAVCILLVLLTSARIKQKKHAVAARYGTLPAGEWSVLARKYQNACEHYEMQAAASNAERQRLTADRKQRQEVLEALTQGETPSRATEQLQQILTAYDRLEEHRKDHKRALSMYTMAKAMARELPAKPEADELTLTAEQTEKALNDCRFTQRQLHTRLGQCQGQMELLGRTEMLEKQLDAVSRRIEKLEDTYAALSIAQRTLETASAELQRRFAPRISRRAEELFAQMTEGRYDRLTMDEDMRLNAGAKGETTLHSAQWRSDGTVDQLYLSLRLAVSDALTPEAPLILDDALVRFDDRRLAAALKILRQEAQNKQVILFTCQGREKNIQ